MEIPEEVHPSHSSEGETAWHYSQAPYDLDAPLPETAIPRLLGTIYVHRNVNDGGYQVWVWYKRDGNGLAWQPVDLKNEQIAHPKIADRTLKLTSTGKPSWILNSTATTYRSRTLRRSRSRSAAPSTFEFDSGELTSAYESGGFHFGTANSAYLSISILRDPWIFTINPIAKESPKDSLNLFQQMEYETAALVFQQIPVENKARESDEKTNGNAVDSDIDNQSLEKTIPVACPEPSDQNIQPAVQSHINYLKASWGHFTAFGQLNPLIITVGHLALTVGVFISVRNHTSQLQGPGFSRVTVETVLCIGTFICISLVFRIISILSELAPFNMYIYP
ncbi:uncharacterized protein C8R40DRAFT_1069446 [Lentinula edodes]|uniref:uncharacterized protein n=1 Tax=Lentinula edodes TaxID=5353 RepID=UPI001E8EE504|nr:uncharacterized protein C8R40DRAFT_1069446 [Lentinula edodes]KAH7875430.1 hypothetical protein C8R40DRAFT_1069446 [Lentinula edodes]